MELHFQKLSPNEYIAIYKGILRSKSKNIHYFYEIPWFYVYLVKLSHITAYLIAIPIFVHTPSCTTKNKPLPGILTLSTATF